MSNACDHAPAMLFLMEIMEIEGLGPALVIHIRDRLKRQWPGGIDTDRVARVIAGAPRRR
jgi:hypothetical protein